MPGLLSGEPRSPSIKPLDKTKKAAPERRLYIVRTGLLFDSQTAISEGFRLVLRVSGPAATKEAGASCSKNKWRRART
ncbi:hypothetical protein BOSE62_40193 [Bosea sp. 62]|nr:hypothetical protein BOSE46_120595 [Bosea sp. 46]CAD5263567.1 hypothetical protein BOSE21B_110826 [Bosea sp. 21B]CAD5276697.1 hypothetical protein BOSE7B_40391 [Bosea sp. 7B]VVT59009.1 hypothetical protein BOS5A_200876 [Bosea sp. EC-HK365B]VXB65294.1 hypothetical protein BOSE29B_110760 [Bosea sp. 29B]VXC05807.1 hypothetical protein BOSE125_160551 [Bosea sp. 125]VXC35524.1 hypothetical protein BOSE62_40193 [Bosea sp. 62]VXC78066.1 hypothetical protein BOSE127_50098 [Bosea sp. 127]